LLLFAGAKIAPDKVQATALAAQATAQAKDKAQALDKAKAIAQGKVLHRQLAHRQV